MKTAIKTSILQGIIIPTLAFLAYGILCWLSDPLGAVRADICVMIPLAVLALAVVRRIRPMEQKSMSKKHVAAMTAAFVLAVCAPAQLMVHAQASIESASGWLYIAKSLVTAPILEEVTYRGIIFGLSRRVLGFWPATAVSATIFQMAHIEPELAIITIPLAIATAGVYELTGRIRYGILLHSIFNLIAIFFVDIHIPRLIALPLYALSMILLVIVVSKRDALARILRVQAGNGRLLCG